MFSYLHFNSLIAYYKLYLSLFKNLLWNISLLILWDVLEIFGKIYSCGKLENIPLFSFLQSLKWVAKNISLANSTLHITLFWTMLICTLYMISYLKIVNKTCKNFHYCSKSKAKIYLSKGQSKLRSI